MQFRYSCPRKSLVAFTKQVTVMAGFVLLPFTLAFQQTAHAMPLEAVNSTDPTTALPQPQREATDQRIICLKKFLARLHCPVTNLSEEFVHAADDNHLDWRLLPSISVIESGGGKAFKNNNIFGWNNGSDPFPTILAGLNEVAFKLGRSPLYRNHDLLGKLKVYNRDSSYASSVMTVMNRISPVENLVPARRAVKRQAEFVYATD